VGSCIGVRGNRIQSIVNELPGEKIDIVSWDQDPKVFIAKALSPSEVVAVELSPGDMTAMVVVPDRQLSLAIGKEGQNTRLAARLTGWRLDIKGMTEWEEIREARRLKIADEAKSVVEEVDEPPAEAEHDVAVAEVEEEVLVATDTLAESPAAVDTAETNGVAELTAQQTDEDEILEALIREEEGKAELETAAAVEQASSSFSVDDLDSFTLVDVGTIADDDDQEEEEDGEEELVMVPDSPAMAVVTPDAGKIRFAEDLIDETRGPGRRNNRARRGGAARKGPANRRGGGR